MLFSLVYDTEGHPNLQYVYVTDLRVTDLSERIVQTEGGVMSATMPGTDEHIAVYQAHRTQFENLMSRRFQLLTLVPGSTVASFAITLFSDPAKTPSLQHLIFPLGLIGICFLIGLFMAVRISFREGHILDHHIQSLEGSLWQTPKKMPHEDSLFNQKIMASLLFSVSLAGWVCVALWFVVPPGTSTALSISSVLTLPLFILSYRLLHTTELPSNEKALQPSAKMFLPRRQG